jgi:hypothetical protein
VPFFFGCQEEGLGTQVLREGDGKMARWNKDKKVLDHEHTQFWKFDLKDVEVPNLQKDVFPYDEVCRIDFDHKIMSINPAEDMFITDTTFRDGQQARPPYNVRHIVDLYALMSRLGGPNGVIRQSEFFLVYSSQDYFHLFLCFKAFFIGGFPIMKRTSYPTLVI